MHLTSTASARFRRGLLVTLAAASAATLDAQAGTRGRTLWQVRSYGVRASVTAYPQPGEARTGEVRVAATRGVTAAGVLLPPDVLMAWADNADSVLRADVRAEPDEEVELRAGDFLDVFGNRIALHRVVSGRESTYFLQVTDYDWTNSILVPLMPAGARAFLAAIRRAAALEW